MPCSRWEFGSSRVRVAPSIPHALVEGSIELVLHVCGSFLCEWDPPQKNMLDLDPDSVYIPKVSGADLHEALEGVSKSVSEAEVKRYEAFRDKFRARDGATGSGVSAGMRPATSTSVASGAGAGVGAGAGAAVSAASRMPDGTTSSCVRHEQLGCGCAAIV